MSEFHDLVIVGGGMAGMTAAIYAARANLDVLVLEREICGGLANTTYSVENFPSWPRINGMELMEKVKDHVRSLDVAIEEIAEVVRIEPEGDRKTVVTAERDYTCRSLILATGRVPIRLPIETDWEEHVHYCSVCDGAGYRGKDLVVVGGGNSGFDESLYLADLGVRSIVIVEAMDHCVADTSTQRRALDTGRIKVRTSTRVAGIAPQAGRGRIAIEDVRSGASGQLDADGLFVFIGQRPNTGVLEGRIALDESGYIGADSLMHTSCPGVFAAGDVVAKRYRQLTTAMADGTIAALEAVSYIRAAAHPGAPAVSPPC
jgi:thioredoxin reductase (NADPH)